MAVRLSGSLRRGRANAVAVLLAGDGGKKERTGEALHDRRGYLYGGIPRDRQAPGRFRARVSDWWTRGPVMY
jgi:hypothetical protein